MTINFGKNNNSASMEKKSIISGHVEEYDIFVFEDVITIQKGKEVVSKNKVKGISDFIKNAKAFRTGWAKFEEDWEVIYFYDKEDNNYGYAVNLYVPDFSEWGYAPF